MAAYNADRVAETIPLVRHAVDSLPHWVPFETDDPVVLRRIVNWLVTNINSPLAEELERDRQRYALEWVGDDGWKMKASEAVDHGDERFIGRLRIRAKRGSRQRSE